MEAVREAWTDERLDDLTVRMDHGFDRVDTDVRDLATRMDHGFERVDTEFRELRGEMNTRFNAVDARFDAMHRTMIIGQRATIICLVGVIGSILATQL